MPWVSLLVIVPLVAAIVLAMIPQHDRMLARTIALAGTGLTVAVSIVVLVLFDGGSGALQQIDIGKDDVGHRLPLCESGGS